MGQFDNVPDDVLQKIANGGMEALSDSELQLVAGGAPDVPDVLQETHPDVSWSSRAIVKNLMNDPGRSVDYLSKKHPELDFSQYDGQIIAKKPGEKQWRALDPKGFDMADITDVGSDIAEAIGVGGATVAGGLAGGLPGAMGAGAGSSFVADALRQGLANLADGKGEYDKGQAALATGLGAFSPVLFGSGATAGRVAAQAAKKGLTQEGAEQLAKQQLSGLRRSLPKAGQFMSGTPSQILEEAPKYMNKIKDMEGDRALVEFAEGVSDNVLEGVKSARTGLQTRIGDALEKSGYMEFDATDIMAPIERSIGELEEKMITKGGLRGTELERLTELKAMKDNLFGMYDETGKLVGEADKLDPASLMQLIQDTKAYSTSALMPPGTAAARKRLMRESENIATQMYKVAEKKIDKAFTDIGEEGLRKEYGALMQMARKIIPKFKDPETAHNTLRQASTKNKQVLFEQLKEYDDMIGTNMADNVKVLEQYRMFHDPSLSQLSGGGGTSTSMTTRGAILGGTLGTAAGTALMGPGLGSLIGGAAGSLAMTGLNTPAVYKKAIQAGMKMGAGKDAVKGGMLKGLDSFGRPKVTEAASQLGRTAKQSSPWAAFELFRDRKD